MHSHLSHAQIDLFLATAFLTTNDNGMTAALEAIQASQSTVLDIYSNDSTAHTSSLPTPPVVGLPFRASANPNSIHAGLSAFLTSFGFLSLLLFTALNMRMLSSPSLSTAAGMQSDHIVLFCCYSLCLMLILLFFAYYIYRVMDGGMLRPKPVRNSDRVLLSGEWLDAQHAHRLQYERSSAVSVWSIVRGDQQVRLALTLLLSLYGCYSLVWQAARLPALDLLVLALLSGAAIAAAVVTANLLSCATAFTLGGWLQPLLNIALLGCPTLHTLSDGLLLAACQLLLCAVAAIAAYDSSDPVAALLFSAIFHCRLLFVSPTFDSLITFLACVLCSLTMRRIASQQPQPTASAQAAEVDSEDDADISEELWRVRQFVCMAAVYAVASNGWRCVHCLLGDGTVQDVTCVATLLLFGVREYKLRERHKQV